MPQNQRAKQPSSEESSSASLNESIGFLLNESSRLSRRLLYGRLAKQGLRGGTWFVLRVLWEGDALTQRELAERLGLTQPSTLEMLRTMERDDLIKFERDTHDKRKTRVFLTPHAHSLRGPMLDLAQETNSVMVERLSPGELVALRMLLRTLRDTTVEAIEREALEPSEDTVRVLKEKKGVEALALAPSKPAKKRRQRSGS